MLKNERCPQDAMPGANFNQNQNFDGFDGMAMPYNMNMNMGACCPTNCCPPCPTTCCPPTCCPPVMECPQERVCHRVMTYEVPHMIPCHTTMVNHHVYNHSYTPTYSYSEVDEVQNVYGNRCC